MREAEIDEAVRLAAKDLWPINATPVPRFMREAIDKPHRHPALWAMFSGHVRSHWRDIQARWERA